MKNRLFIAFIFSFTLLACSKKSSYRYRVSIRVENATQENFINFELNGTAYGAIAVGDTSIYLSSWNVSPVVFANNVYINNQGTYWAEVERMPDLTSGKYLLKIETDSLWKYKGSFKHEQ